MQQCTAATRRLVAVGAEYPVVGQGGVVGDQGEAAVAGGVVGDRIVVGVPGDGVAGAGGAPVAGVGAGPAPVLLPEALLDGFDDGDVWPPGRAGVGQGCRGGGLDGGAGLEPGLRAGQLRGQGVDGGDAGLDARPAGVLVAGGLDGGVDPDDAQPLRRWHRRLGHRPDPGQVTDPLTRQPNGFCPLWGHGSGSSHGTTCPHRGCGAARWSL